MAVISITEKMMASDGSEGLIGVSALLPASLNLNLDLEQDGCGDDHDYNDHTDHYNHNHDDDDFETHFWS